MTTLVPMCGLPRSGSTLLVNLINQHPDVYGSPDSLLSGMVKALQEKISESMQDSQYNADLSYDIFYNFCRGGIISWVDKLTDKKIFLDKCRGWIELIDICRNTFPYTKFIVCIRDLRGTYSSFLKVEKTTPLLYKDGLLYGDQTYDYREVDIENQKIDDVFGQPMMRRNLVTIKELLDCNKLDNTFLFVRYEDLIKNPREQLFTIYEFLNLPDHKNDLDNIEQIPYHDSMFLPYGRHKIKPKMQSFDPWDFDINKKAEDKIIQDNLWYYSEFYPEVLEVSKT
nr:Protein-tyrosine sulfotransferase 2 like protein [uncultured Mediterranean phage uvMED]|tara:strand:+ start:16482 stop:17330 length:849 start_codon:yes stop_codon:yes gene_type:complete